MHGELFTIVDKTGFSGTSVTYPQIPATGHHNPFTIDPSWEGLTFFLDFTKGATTTLQLQFEADRGTSGNWHNIQTYDAFAPVFDTSLPQLWKFTKTGKCAFQLSHALGAAYMVLGKRMRVGISFDIAPDSSTAVKLYCQPHARLQ